MTTLPLSANSRGIALMLTSILFFTLMDATAKQLTATNPPLMVIWARYAGQVAWTVLILAPRLPRLLRTRNLGLQMGRSVLLFGTTACMYVSLSHLDLAEATAIFQVAPLLTTLLAMAFLHEMVGPRRWIALLVGLVGAVVIVRPGAAVFTPYALLPVAGAFFYSAYAIATRFLSAQESPLTSFVYTALFGTVMASLTLPFVWQTPARGDLVLFGLIGMIGGLGQLFLILALRVSSASVLSPFLYVGLAVASVWGVIFFDTWPDAATWAGAAMIVGAGLFIWWRDRRA